MPFFLNIFVIGQLIIDCQSNQWKCSQFSGVLYLRFEAKSKLVIYVRKQQRILLNYKIY